MNKDRIKDIIATIVFILIIVLAVLFYPMFVSVDKDGQTHCKNLLGREINCREKNNP